METVFVGCSGFYYREWRKYFYPKTIPPKDWLPYYTSRFNTVEINSSFYHLPKLPMLRRWYKIAPPFFRFTLKAPRVITHFNQFQNTEENLNQFYALAQTGLQDKLAAILFQLPGTLAFSKELLQTIVQQLNPAFLNVIEFRHASWWCPETYEALQKHRITFCSVSFPNLPASVIKTSNTVYIRFHGIPKLYYSAYSDNDLTTWAEQIKEAHAENTFCYFNNTAALEAIYNAYTLKNKLI